MTSAPVHGPNASRLYRIGDISSRLNGRLESIHSSIRALGHTIHDRINRLHTNTNAASNGIIINNDVESAENCSNGSISDVPIANSSSSHISASTAASECPATPSGEAPSRHHRRSSRRARTSFRHSYPLISIRTLEKDRNVLAAILSIVVLAILSTALAQFKWFSIYNDLCESHFYSKSDSPEKDIPTHYHDQILEQQHVPLRQQPFANARPFQSGYPTAAPVILYGIAPGYKLGCSTPQIIALKRTIIGLCFLAIMCSMIQCFLDILGAKRKWVNTMRTHAVGNIITVLICIFIIGLVYFISILYERAQLHHFFRKFRPTPSGMLKPFKPSPLDKTQYDFLAVHQVKFELSYYLVTLAGFLSILAAAANLFRRPRQILIERISHSRHRNRLNGDESSLLASDLLNNESSGYFPYYHPSNWMFNPNYFYSLDTASTGSSSSSRPANIPFAPPAVTTPCPPPPPYSP